MISPRPLPPPVLPGDRIGVAALSGPVEPERLERGLAALRQLGFEPVPARNLASRWQHFAGRDEERLAAFHELAADITVRAIVFARGGHGVLRLLPAFDWALLAARPRAYVGYSDLAPFLAEVVRRLGIVAFHGPMVAADLARGLSAEEEASFLGALAGRYPAEVPLAGGEGTAVAGVLLGGCLSLLTATLGTPYAPPLAGCLLFVEDVNEPAYRLDRLLTHLRLSGTLASIRGMIVGHLDGGETPFEGAEGRELAQAAADPHGWPVGWGLPAGHRAPNLTLPLGAAARLDPAARRLVVGLPSPAERGGAER